MKVNRVNRKFVCDTEIKPSVSFLSVAKELNIVSRI